MLSNTVTYFILLAMLIIVELFYQHDPMIAHTSESVFLAFSQIRTYS